MRVPKHACICLLTDALQQAQLRGQAHELRSHLYQKSSYPKGMTDLQELVMITHPTLAQLRPRPSVDT